MPAVTKIEQQKQNIERYSVFVDDKYAFSLPANALMVAGLRTGDELSAADLESFLRLSVESKAIERCYRFLSIRKRSRQELQGYLSRKGYEEEIVSAVIQKLTEQGMADDADFAASWIQSRQQTKPRSRKQLQQELLKKGLSREDIDDALQFVDDEAEVEAAASVANKKRRLSRFKDNDVLISYLQTQGFGYQTITAALERLLEVD